MGGVEYQVTKVDPTDPHTKGAVYQVHKVSEEVAATLGGKVYRARIINDPTDPTVAGKVYQIVLIGDPDDPAVKGKVYNAILADGSEAVVVGPAVSPLALDDAIANTLSYVKAFGGTEQRNLPSGYTQQQYIYMMARSYVKVEDLPISAGYRVEFDFQTLTLSSPLRNYLGGRAGGVSAGGGFRLSKLAASSNSRVVLYGFESGTEYYDPTAQFAANTRYKYTYDNGVCTLESGGSVISTKTFTVTDNTSTNWGINSYANGTYTLDSDGIYVYSLKVWNDQGELVMHLVPAIQQGTVPVVGFYDTVDGTFRTATAGTLAAGPEIAPTPDAPIDIVSNNGVLKYSANMANVNAQTALIGYYISSSGVVTADTNNWVYQDYIPVSPNTKYTLTMSSPVYYVTISEYSTADDSGFIRRNTGASGDNTTLTITTDANTNFIRFGTNIDRAKITLERVLAINCMLNKGDSMPYTPYSPTGVYADDTVETINVHGKNLFDIDSCIANTFVNNTGTVNTSTSWKCSGFIPVSPNTAYVFTVDTTSGATAKHCFYAQEQTESFISYIDSGSQTFTTPPNARYMRISVRKESAQAQLELGTTATTYAPYYNGGTATAEMLLNVGDYQDEQEILSGAITRNVGVKVLDGTENGWAKTNNSFSNNTLFADKKIEKSTLFCSHFQYDTGSTSTILDCCIGCASTSTNTYFRNDALSTDGDWKQWLADQYAAGTPVIVVYPLAEPTTESVAGQALQVTQGDNVVEITQASIDDLELEAEYEKEAA